MQQDWKTVWDNLNPDEAAKERMKQAILQKMYAEVQPKKTQKNPFSLQWLRLGTLARAAALLLCSGHGCRRWSAVFGWETAI